MFPWMWAVSNALLNNALTDTYSDLIKPATDGWRVSGEGLADAGEGPSFILRGH